jgi:hypothetical protein
MNAPCPMPRQAASRCHARPLREVLERERDAGRIETHEPRDERLVHLDTAGSRCISTGLADLGRDVASITRPDHITVGGECPGDRPNPISEFGGWAASRVCLPSPHEPNGSRGAVGC